MTEATPESTERRPGRRAPLIVTAVLLAGAAAVALWLQATDRLPPPDAGAPNIVVDLPKEIPAGPELAAVPPTGSEPSTGAAPAGEAPPDPAVPEPEELAAAGREAESTGQPADAALTPTPAPPAPDPAGPEETTAEEPQAPGGDPRLEAAPEAPPPPVVAAPEPADPPVADHAAEPGPATRPADAAPNEDAPAASTPEAAAPAGEAPQVAMAWQRLARPFPEDETRPRIAVVVAGLGLSEAATTAAIQQLPAEITLSFSPYSNRLEEFVAMARAAGHEVLLDLPMEPASFPRDDPGPRALLTSLDEDANAERLAWTLGRADGYLGVATYMGSRFTTSPEDLRPVIEELGRRGLLLLDSRAAADSIAARLAAEAGVAHAINDRFIDNEASRVAIDGRLQQVERIARGSGAAVAMGYAYPVTIERLTAWARDLAGEGLALAPISAVVDRQEVR